MNTRSKYYSLRHEYRNFRRQLGTNPAAFERCLAINSLGRELTGRWETGFCSPAPRMAYPRKGCKQPICSNALSFFLAD